MTFGARAILFCLASHLDRSLLFPLFFSSSSSPVVCLHYALYGVASEAARDSSFLVSIYALAAYTLYTWQSSFALFLEWVQVALFSTILYKAMMRRSPNPTAGRDQSLGEHRIGGRVRTHKMSSPATQELLSFRPVVSGRRVLQFVCSPLCSWTACCIYTQL